MSMKKQLSKESLIKVLKTYWVFLMSILLIIIDQVTKLAFQSYLQDVPNNYVEIIPNLFRWQLVYNEGAAWSMFAGDRIFLSATSILASLVLIYAIFHYAKIKNLSNLFKYNFSEPQVMELIVFLMMVE